MVTRVWIFPGGEEINLMLLDNEIERIKRTAEPQEIPPGQHPIPVEGMVDQLYDYALDVQEEYTLLLITGRPDARTRAGRVPHPGTQTYILPQMAPSAPILSGKYDGKQYLFALVETSLV